MPHCLHSITPREAEVLRLLALGLSEKQIARKLGRSVHTIHVHTRRAHEKLGALNRANLIYLAIEMGIVGSRSDKSPV